MIVKFILEAIMILGITAFAMCFGALMGDTWFYKYAKIARKPKIDTHVWVKGLFVLVPFLMVMSYLLYNYVTWIDIMLIGLYGVLQWTFFFEGVMYSVWNNNDSTAHIRRWKSSGTNPSVWNPTYYWRSFFFILAIFDLIILFTYHIV